MSFASKIMHPVVGDRHLVDTTEERASLEDPLVIKNKHIQFIYKQKNGLQHIFAYAFTIKLSVEPKRLSCH